jgi:hypothetical protein
MSSASPDQRTPADPTNKDVRRAVQAIGLIVAVVLFNLALCVGIFWLARRDFVGGSFPALVLFLSFALSVGIILITVLGEKLDTSKVENEWIKKIGVTPIMTVVAVLLSLLAGFSPLANMIIVVDPYSSQFMLAKIAVTCSSHAKGDLPQATDLLVVISSPEKDYIKRVDDLLNNAKSLKSWMRSPQDPRLEIVRADPNDEIYKLLQDYGDKTSESLTEAMRSAENWIAYKTPINAPTIDTLVPVPTLYEKSNSTRLFVVTKQLTRTSQPELTSLVAAANSATASPKLKLTPLFQAGIVPRKPLAESFLTELGFQVFADSGCWHTGV